ncbi:MAG: hypothetical protein ABII07_04745 [Patescibacteria group bacterium]
MLLNCLKCGKSISSKKELCPYCRHEIPMSLQEETRKHGSIKGAVLKGNYKGTILSFVVRR